MAISITTSWPVRGSPPERGGVTSPSPERGGCDTPPPPPADPAGGRNGSRACATAGADAARTSTAQRSSSATVRLTSFTVRRCRRERQGVTPGGGRGGSYPSDVLPKALLRFARLRLSKNRSSARDRGVASFAFDGTTKTRRDHVRWPLLVSVAARRRRVPQKLYSAVAFGSPLLTSAEYSDNLAHPNAVFKGNETHSKETDGSFVARNRRSETRRRARIRAPCPERD